MVDVRIRHEFDDEAQPLGEVPLTREALDMIIPLLLRWGISDEDGNPCEDGHQYGQFRVTKAGAYFEVVLSSEHE